MQPLTLYLNCTLLSHFSILALTSAYPLDQKIAEWSNKWRFHQSVKASNLSQRRKQSAVHSVLFGHGDPRQQLQTLDGNDDWYDRLLVLT